MHKTTLYIPDDLILQLRRRATETGETMTKIIQSAVRLVLQKPYRRSSFLKARGISRKRNPFGDPVKLQNALRDEWAPPSPR